MPLVAVAGAVFAGSSIAAAGGLAAMGFFPGMAAVGAITAGIGALTGNENLMKLGGVATLAGGVGMFASGKGWFGAGQTLGEATEPVSNIKAMSSTPGVGVESVTPDVDMGFYPGGEASGASSGVTAGLENTAANNITAPSSAANTPTAPGLIDSMNPDSGLASAAKQTAITPPAVKSSSPFDALQKFADIFKDKDGKYNKDMLSMGLNFAGGFFDDKKKSEQAFLDAKTGEINSQLKNASAIPDMSGLKVNPKSVFKNAPPTYMAPRIGGLMNAKA